MEIPTLSSVKLSLTQRFSSRGVEFIGNDRVVVLSEEPISEALQTSILRECQNFAVVFFTKSVYQSRFLNKSEITK